MARASKEKRRGYYQDPERKLKYRKAYIEKTFGIGYDLYEKMSTEQNNLCLICQQPERSKMYKYLAVDHDHETGSIRGLLCNNCNRALGLFGDCPQTLMRASLYLERTKGK